MNGRKSGMSIRTDLALETVAAAKTQIPGIIQEKREGAGCTVTEITVESDMAGMRIGKSRGIYVTVETDRANADSDEFNEAVDAMAEEIGRLLPKEGEILVLGLGNNDITPDALGPQAIARILATRHLSAELGPEHPFSALRPVCALAPGVLGQTGIEVAEIARSLCDRIKPAGVIAVDALACADIKRLGRTIQITDTGISPGSGVQNKRKEISKATLGVPVVALGVPTVVDMHTIAENISGKAPEPDMPNMIVTPRDIDKLIERMAKFVGFAINKALFPEMTVEDFIALS